MTYIELGLVRTKAEDNFGKMSQKRGGNGRHFDDRLICSAYRLDWCCRWSLSGPGGCLKSKTFNSQFQ